MDSLVGLGNDGLDSLEVRSLGGPISGGSRSVLVSGQDDQLLTILLISLGSIEDGQFLSGWDVEGIGSDLVVHLVDESGVGEGSSGHDFVVSSSGSVGVEILSLDSSLFEVGGSGGILGDVSGWGDVISGDEVSEVGEAVGSLDAWDWLGDLGDSIEVGWLVDIGGGLLPLVLFGWLNLEVVPSGGSLGDLGVVLSEHVRVQELVDGGLDLFSGWPDILQEDVLSLGVNSDWVSLEIDVHGSSQSVGNDQGG